MEVHLVSHTHWDREWYLTYEQFRLRLVALVDRMLDLMERSPDYAFFHLDGQTIVLEDYLELRPEQEPRLRALIDAKRVLIGPWYDMPDEFLVSGESLVRNLALGHRVARRFGEPMPVGYLPDLFGHVGQMPQILRGFGLDNTILWRGFGGPRAEYWWEAPDGSRVLMMHLPPEGYCNATRVHFKPELMIERASKAIETEAARTQVGQVLLMNGVDHVEPHPIIPELTRQLTESLGVPVRHSTLPAYVDAVRKAVQGNGSAPQLEVVRGELRSGEEYANLLPGVLSARVYIKQANTRVQTWLEKRAEPLAAFASALGARYPHAELRHAWKMLIQNHPHDSICGCSVDPVHEENMTRFARAEQVARGVAEVAADAIVRAVPPGAPGTLRVVAVNTTGFDFNGIVEATLDLPYANAEPRRSVDPEALDAPVVFWPAGASVTAMHTHDGRALPFQVLGREDVITFVMSRYETPWALHASRVRLAWRGTVPALGYTTVDVSVGAAPAAAPAPQRTAENAFLRVAINDDGTVDVTDKRSGVEYPRCGELEDLGDVGDEYNYSPPVRADRRVTSADLRDVSVTCVEAGPIRHIFRIEGVLPLPSGSTADRGARTDDAVPMPVSITVTLDDDSPRLGWRVRVENGSEDHRLRILFPVGADAIATVRAETAFGVVERPARRLVPPAFRNELPVSYAPTIAFTDAGDGRAGATLFGEGLMEYEASAEGPARIGLTLLRAVGYLSREDLVTRPSGHAGPGFATPGAQCPGTHEFTLAFEPWSVRPTASALFARAASFVAPPLVFPVVGGNSLPAEGAFIQISGAPVVVSAVKAADERETTILRLFNPDPTPAVVTLAPRKTPAAAFLVDLLERRGEPIPVTGGAVTLTLPAHRIQTVEFV